MASKTSIEKLTAIEKLAPEESALFKKSLSGVREEVLESP
jgi:hypothetical protein